MRSLEVIMQDAVRARFAGTLPEVHAQDIADLAVEVRQLRRELAELADRHLRSLATREAQ